MVIITVLGKQTLLQHHVKRMEEPIRLPLVVYPMFPAYDRRDSTKGTHSMNIILTILISWRPPLVSVVMGTTVYLEMPYVPGMDWNTRFPLDVNRDYAYDHLDSTKGTVGMKIT